MNEAEIKYITNLIDTETKVSRARNTEMFRAVDLLTSKARDAEPPAAIALLEAARELLGDTR